MKRKEKKRRRIRIRISPKSNEMTSSRTMTSLLYYDPFMVSPPFERSVFFHFYLNFLGGFPPSDTNTTHTKIECNDLMTSSSSSWYCGGTSLWPGQGGRFISGKHIEVFHAQNPVIFSGTRHRCGKSNLCRGRGRRRRGGSQAQWPPGDQGRRRTSFLEKKKEEKKRRRRFLNFRGDMLGFQEVGDGQDMPRRMLEDVSRWSPRRRSCFAAGGVQARI